MLPVDARVLQTKPPAAMIKICIRRVVGDDDVGDVVLLLLLLHPHKVDLEVDDDFAAHRVVVVVVVVITKKTFVHSFISILSFVESARGGSKSSIKEDVEDAAAVAASCS